MRGPKLYQLRQKAFRYRLAAAAYVNRFRRTARSRHLAGGAALVLAAIVLSYLNCGRPVGLPKDLNRGAASESFTSATTTTTTGGASTSSTTTQSTSSSTTTLGPPQADIDIRSYFPSCPTGQTYTYPFMIQSDWQVPAASSQTFTFLGTDTPRLYFDPIPGGVGSQRLLPNNYEVSSGFYFGHTKFGNANSGDILTNNFELMYADSNMVRILIEAEKTTTRDGGPFFRWFHDANNPSAPDGNLLFLHRCVQLNTVIPYPASGQMNFHMRYFTLDLSNYFWRTEEKDGSIQERNWYVVQPVLSQTEYNSLKALDSSYYSQGISNPYPFHTGNLLYSFGAQVPARVLSRANWWNAGGDIFERYYYAEGAGLAGWMWMERMLARYDDEGIQQALTYQLVEGQPQFSYRCRMKSGGQNTIIQLKIDPAQAAAWKRVVDLQEVFAPTEGLQAVTVDGVHGFVHRDINRGWVVPPDQQGREYWYVSCRQSNSGSSSAKKSGVRYQPNLFSDVRDCTNLTSGQLSCDQSTTVAELAHLSHRKPSGLRVASRQGKPNILAWNNPGPPGSAASFCVRWKRVGQQWPGTCLATVNSPEMAFGVDGTLPTQDGFYDWEISIVGKANSTNQSSFELKPGPVSFNTLFPVRQAGEQKVFRNVQ